MIDKRLVVFSSIQHRLRDGQQVAHGGFVREMNLWAKIFAKVVIIAHSSRTPPNADDLPYEEPNIRVVSLPETRVASYWLRRFEQAFLLPWWILRAERIVNRHDVVMARGPESTGFMGVIVTRFRQVPRFARYVDQWKGYDNEPPSYRIQKWFYRRQNFGGPVLIYGSDDPLRPHLVPFFTSSISLSQWEQAGMFVAERVWTPPYRLLFVGRLVESKGLDVLMKALHQLKCDGMPVTLDVVGDGECRDTYVELRDQLDLNDRVTFHGWRGWNDLVRFYGECHCFVHPSRKEGYGKVLLEAMTFALPIIGSDVGVSRSILETPRCGILLPPDRSDILAEGIKSVLADVPSARSMGLRARDKMAGNLMEDLEQAYRVFVTTHLHLPTELL